MPKAVVLTPDALRVAQPMPQAATPARTHAQIVKKPQTPPEAKVPLQVLLPSDEVKAIKVAAAERGMKLNEFMLTCFHAYMKP